MAFDPGAIAGAGFLRTQGPPVTRDYSQAAEHGEGPELAHGRAPTGERLEILPKKFSWAASKKPITDLVLLVHS